MSTPTDEERQARNGRPPGMLDLDALAAEIRAEQHRPTWTTGAQHTDHVYAGIGTVVIDPDGTPAAFCAAEAVARELAEAMTVMSRLEDERATQVQLAFEVGIVREELDVAKRDLAEARREREGAEARLTFEHERNAGLRRQVRELITQKDRLEAEVVNAGHDAVRAAVGRQEAIGLLRKAIARLEDDE